MSRFSLKQQRRPIGRLIIEIRGVYLVPLLREACSPDTPTPYDLLYCRHLNSPFDQKQLPQGTVLTKQSCSKSSLYTLSQGVRLQSEQVE